MAFARLNVNAEIRGSNIGLWLTSKLNQLIDFAINSFSFSCRDSRCLACHSPLLSSHPRLRLLFNMLHTLSPVVASDEPRHYQFFLSE